jgi:23S rRNA (guanosine2251-2'-O)-methyltransferase
VAAGLNNLGGEQVEGRRAVLELLRAGNRNVRAVYVTKELEESEFAELAGSKLRAVTPEKLEAMARSDVHQGVVAQAAPITSADLDVLLDEPNAFLVALDGVTDPHNLGAIMRSAETAGATGVLLPRHRSAKITPVVAKAAAGAIEHLPISLVGGIPNALERASRAGCWTVGLDEHGESSIFDLDLADQKLVLVLGAEGRGLARLTKQRCEMLVRIPMYGRVESLNVAAAATLACHEVARRRNK